jgi:hypothetical protein
VAPAPAPASTGLSWSTTAPGADTTTPAAPKKDDDEPPPLRWRGTSFTWNQAATTQSVGIGKDYQGTEDWYYGWDFTFRPTVFVLDAPKDKVKLSADIGWETELTDGGTVDKRETLFKDLRLAAGYSRSIWTSSDKEYKTSGGLSGSLRLPTSRASSGQGQYLGTSLGLNLSQKVKILGNDADGLNNLTIAGSAGWGHLFARAYTPTNGDLRRPRQNATGQTELSDQLRTGSFSMNTVSLGIDLSVPLYGDLSLSTGLSMLARIKHDFDGKDCEARVDNLPGGCAEVSRLDDRTLYQPDTGFGVSLGYPVYEVVDLTIGYQNQSRWIGEDGTRRSVFYSPDAQFYLDVTANLDSIYSKIADRNKRSSEWAQSGQARTGWY